MTDNAPPGQAAPLPALREIAPELDRFARAGRWLAAVEGKAGDTPAEMAAALRLLLVDDMGLNLTAALEMPLVAGRLVVGSKIKRSQAERAGYRVVQVHGDATSCTAGLVNERTGEEVGRVTFTIEQARRAGLASKKNWTTYPERMLWARASGYVVDDYLPSAALGLITPDEAAEIEGAPVPYDLDAEVEPDPVSNENSPETPESLSGGYDPTVEPLDRTEQATAEAEWREGREREERRRAHDDLSRLIVEIDHDGTAPPPGHDSWTDFAAYTAHARFGIREVAALDAGQLQAVIEAVDHTAAMLTGPPS